MKSIGRTIKILLFTVMVTTMVVVSALALNGASRNREAGLGSEAINLPGEVKKDLEQRTLMYTTHRYKVLTGTPRVLVVRDLTTQDVSSLGSCGYHYDPSDPRYALTVLRGDLDLSNMPGGAKPDDIHPDNDRYGFIAYVYDASSTDRQPIAEYTSRNGGAFRVILGDPSLPDDIPPGAPTGTQQVDLTMDPSDCPPLPKYETNPDEVAPPLPDPGE